MQALVGALAVAAGAHTASLNDPYAVFARARHRLQAARYPAQVSYDVTISVTSDGKTSLAHYHSCYDSRSDAVRVVGVSDEERAHPYTPHGINTVLSLFGPSGKGIPLSSAQHTFDYLGVPILAPNYSFGVARYAPQDSGQDFSALVQEIRRQFHEPPKAVSATPAPSSEPKTIASVEAISRDYVMQLAGTEIVDGHDDYRLALQPVRDPGRYRLRQLWVNANTFALDRVVTQGNFVSGGATGVTWTTDFADVAGRPYIESERTDQAFSDAGHHYESARVAFSNIAPTRIPPYMSLSEVLVDPATGVPPLVEPPS